MVIFATAFQGLMRPGTKNHKEATHDITSSVQALATLQMDPIQRCIHSVEPAYEVHTLLDPIGHNNKAQERAL